MASEPVQDPTVACPQDKSWFSSSDWIERHQSLLEAAREQGERCNLVFLGDSITEGWAGEGRDIWETKYGGPYNAVNLGIGGDEVQHVLWRVQNGELDSVPNTKCIVLLIGTNNIGNAGHDPQPVADGVQLLIDELKERLPSAKILLMAVFPRDAKPDTHFRKQILALNRLLHRFRDGQNVFYLDIGEYLTNYKQDIESKVMPDFLHLSIAGYTIWAEKMHLTLNRLMHGRAGRQISLLRKSGSLGTPDVEFNVARPNSKL